MQIIVFADSHTDIETMRSVIALERPDFVIHLGDHAADGAALRKYSQELPMLIVRGNTDFTSAFPEEETVSFHGTKIFAAHGHRYSVKSGLSAIAEKGLGIGADIVLFGHTHVPFSGKIGGVTLLNPGRVGRISSRIIGSTYGVILLEGDSFNCEVKDFPI